MNGKRAIIIDDDLLVCQVLAKMLAKSQIETVTAINGVQAIAELNKENTTFHMAVIDLVLPHGPNGWDILNLISKRPDADKILTIVLTGASISEEEIQRLKKKAKMVIRKQEFSIEMFQDIINTSLKDGVSA